MRKIDQHKLAFEKAAKTINFDKIILEKLEEKARNEGSTVSNMVNFFMRKVVLNDVLYYRAKAKHHALEAQKFQYMKNEAEEMDKQELYEKQLRVIQNGNNGNRT